MIHNVAKRPVQAPLEMWWVITTVISPLLDKIAITFTKIQARNIVISQQRQKMSKLVANIIAGLDIRPATDEALEGVDPLTIITQSDWFILKDSVVMHIQDQGSWVRDLYNALSDFDKQTTLKEITIFGIFIVANVSQIDDVEKEHRQLRAVYDNEPHVTKAFDQHDENTFFNDAWDVVKGRFSGLRQFCGGLATMFPNTAAVEIAGQVGKKQHSHKPDQPDAGWYHAGEAI
ncbi:unnamed protein product [Sphagnum jensenii]|uniref:Uncharacterized protein n=1 Tax=Sphagnum jensenii TaxID=128206 RepID=A0ABP1AKN2_9BRYO